MSPVFKLFSWLMHSHQSLTCRKNKAWLKHIHNQISKMTDPPITYALQIGFYDGLMLSAIFSTAHGAINAFVFTAAMIHP